MCCLPRLQGSDHRDADALTGNRLFSASHDRAAARGVALGSCARGCRAESANL